MTHERLAEEIPTVGILAKRLLDDLEHPNERLKDGWWVSIGDLTPALVALSIVNGEELGRDGCRLTEVTEHIPDLAIPVAARIPQQKPVKLTIML
jgi:hypothetical protein